MFTLKWSCLSNTLLLVSNFMPLNSVVRANISVTNSIYAPSDEETNSVASNASACIVKYLRNYFDDIRSIRKTIYLVANKNSNDPNSVEGHFLTDLNGAESQWLSIPVFTLTESIDYSQSDSSLASDRRDFVFFHNGINAKRAMDRLIVDVQLGTSHLHVICVENCSDKQISLIFKSLLRTRFGRNVHVLTQRSVDNCVW